MVNGLVILLVEKTSIEATPSDSEWVRREELNLKRKNAIFSSPRRNIYA